MSGLVTKYKGLLVLQPKSYFTSFMLSQHWVVTRHVHPMTDAVYINNQQEQPCDPDQFFLLSLFRSITVV